MRKTISITFLCISALLLSTNISAQKDSSDYSGRPAFYAQILGPEGLGVHTNIFINKRSSVNFGLGINLDAHIGSNFYFTKRNEHKGAFYLGAQLCSYRIFKFNFTGKERQLAAYFPFGFEFIGKKGLSFQIDIGPNFIQQDWGQYNTLPFFGSLKIGFSPPRKH